MRRGSFWDLVFMQEPNSVLKNTCQFDSFYVAVRERLNRPLDKNSLILMKERRSAIAPCDNLGEIVPPVVIIAAIGLEVSFDALPGLAGASAVSGEQRHFRRVKAAGVLPSRSLAHACDHTTDPVPLLLGRVASS